MCEAGVLAGVEDLSKISSWALISWANWAAIESVVVAQLQGSA